MLRESDGTRAPQFEDAHDELAERKPERDGWLKCVHCAANIAHQQQRLELGGSHVHRFINPGGYVYRVRLFSDARGLTSVGKPSTEWSWFAGHSWLIQNCRRCQSHLGWLFERQQQRFFGLIANQLQH